MTSILSKTIFSKKTNKMGGGIIMFIIYVGIKEFYK